MASATYTNSKNISTGAPTGEVYKPGDRGFYARDINHALRSASTNRIAQTVTQKPLKNLRLWEATLQNNAVVIRNGTWTIRDSAGNGTVLEAQSDLWDIFAGEPDESKYSRLTFELFDADLPTLNYIDVCVYIMPFADPAEDEDYCKSPATYLASYSQAQPTGLKFAIGKETEDRVTITSNVEHRRICTIRLTRLYDQSKYIPTSIINHVADDIFMDSGPRFPWENLNFGYTLGTREDELDPEIDIPIVTINSGFVRQHGLRTYSVDQTEIDLSGSDVVVYIEINRITNNAVITSASALPASSSSFVNLPLYSFQIPLGGSAYILNRIYHMGDYDFDTPIR